MYVIDHKFKISKGRKEKLEAMQDRRQIFKRILVRDI
jgi:hypothetical protein